MFYVENGIYSEVKEVIKELETNLKLVEANKIALDLQEEKLKAEQKKLLVGLSTNFQVRAMYFLVRHPCATIASQFETGIRGYFLPKKPHPPPIKKETVLNEALRISTIRNNKGNTDIYLVLPKVQLIKIIDIANFLKKVKHEQILTQMGNNFTLKIYQGRGIVSSF